jgi:hypothetical protein
MFELKHSFIRRCINRHELLEGVYKFNTFASRLEKQAKKYGGDDDKSVNEYKGWGFELFGEALVRSRPYDKRIGISEYRLVEEDDDTGVDDYGIGSNGNPATVQFKYRQADYVLTTNADHLTNFTYASLHKFKVTEDCNMLIITSGKELHWHTQQHMLGVGVRCLNRQKIRKLVDDQKPFWDDFRASWEIAVKV